MLTKNIFVNDLFSFFPWQKPSTRSWRSDETYSYGTKYFFTVEECFVRHESCGWWIVRIHHKDPCWSAPETSQHRSEVEEWLLINCFWGSVHPSHLTLHFELECFIIYSGGQGVSKFSINLGLPVESSEGTYFPGSGWLLLYFLKRLVFELLC